MTTEIDALKTNEFIRRRKLRLQQVREQSKDIAKKIRQRAKVEKLKQVVELDTNKQKEYFKLQEQLVKQLEEFYAKGIKNVGVSHQNAAEIRQKDNHTIKDLSKQRGREAAAELRKKKQDKLDEQKKLLDRKLLAREAANEASREKSATVSNKLVTKPNKDDVQSKDCVPNSNIEVNDGGDSSVLKCIDMATQWDLEPDDWVANIPKLSLPKDDKEIKDNNNTESKSDKSKRLDLFALSEEMPSSLRGGLTTQERIPVKSSLTLVSEYLQNRGLRLRETDTVESTKKKNMDELHTLKQTILRTRAAKEVSAKGDSGDKASKTSVSNTAVPKKSSITMYNHSTRIERDIPYNDERLVVRDLQIDDDAYSQAMKESCTVDNVKDHQNKVQKVRSKIAMNKKNVEKEYRDTISFLNALPKDMGNKPIRRAYMDEGRQQSIKDSRQQKLQQEYKKIMKDCKKPNCRNKTRTNSKSPSDDFKHSDFQYSWMPVPESDGKLAIHTIPTSLKEGKSGNSVKFSKVDSYHEYRSRHKHTPPTKDVTQQPKRYAEADPVQTSSDSESASSETSSIGSIQLEKKEETLKNTERLSDAERIIIYKILDSKNEKSKNSKIMKDIAKSLSLIKQKTTNENKLNSKKSKTKEISSDSVKRISLEELNEGVYKAVNENGTEDNVTSMYFNKDRTKIELTEDNIKFGRSCCCNKTLAKDQQNERGTTSLQWENCDNPPQVPRPSNSCSECKCGCKTPEPKLTKVMDENVCERSAPHPSAATSTSSVKTPTNNKSNALPDGGYIKLIDEGGEDAGKFYIGASGFLRDDAYEVVIQVKKKGDERELREITKELTKINEEDLLNRVPVSAVTTQVTAPLETAEEVYTARSVSNDLDLNQSNRDNKLHDLVVNIALEDTRNDNNFSRETNEDINPPPKKAKQVSDKGVSTSFKDSFAIPIHIPKSDSNPRAATSTYTQTSMSSPNQRPVFFHMSSSTSTAYMSPPEMILPKFLRQDHRMSDEDLYDPRNFETQDKIEVMDEYCEHYECKCKKCRHARMITLCRTRRCKKATHRAEKARTPPNTASSNQDQEELDEATELDSNTRENCSCRKCRSRNCSDKPIGSNSHVNKNKRMTPTKRSSQSVITRTTYNSASINKDGQMRRNKPNMNPVIRDYVNKLLALNKESLKAIEVVDQDCSSVATPESSIINIPNNSNNKKHAVENKISLEQIRTMLKQQILCESEKNYNNSRKHSDVCLKDQINNYKKPKVARKKNVHKVKSLNISKRLFKSKEMPVNKPAVLTSSSSSAKGNLKEPPFPSRNKIRSKSSPTPRSVPGNPEVVCSKTSANIALNITKEHSLSVCKTSSKSKSNIYFKESKPTRRLNTESSGLSCHRATTISTSPNSETSGPRQKGNNHEWPSNISTQTSNVDSEINFLRFDEDKIQNMEKIADLTEKCTKRLSNLAKVLEEVRRNKSLAYSHISTSDTASDSDQKSDRNANTIPTNVYQSFHDTQKSLESKSPDAFSPVEDFNKINQNSDGYEPFLKNIPKPDSIKTPTVELNNSFNSNKSNPLSLATENCDHHLKSRGKPPPALSRIHLKHVQDYVIPHELSTVVEVDSPMSVKLKSQTSRNETRLDNMPDNNNQGDHENKERNTTNLDLLGSNVNTSGQTKVLITDSSDDSKIQMIDMNQFNEIMLKPFFSLQEYAKRHNVGALDDGSNLEEVARGDIINDELSSLHSDGSLPDVISELLKRNIISEPFKFDTQSNVNSTTISSESTLSVMALSKTRKEKKKSSVMFQNKDNVGETSDTLSISSNPDLENAFKMLGMGWASSTLKKTKERLALSSSSNTSSSSLSQFKIRSFNHDIPVLVTDAVTSVLNLSNKQQKQQQKVIEQNSKNAEQQTSLTNSMTVNEFLTNELANKITFTNNKSRNDTEDEFMSLFETKMPEEMKHASRFVREDSVDNSIRSVNNNRARTSTPVQLFKSMTYRSSSSSNISNGLFSNADDLSSVKQTSNSMKHSTSDKDDLTIPNFSLRIKKGSLECSKSD